MTTNINAAPFYDDYDAEKNYYRVLFKPRRVQTRELNQIQSILQNQISSFADSIYQDGSVVGKGTVSVKADQTTLLCSMTSSFNTEILSVDPKDPSYQGPFYLGSKTGTLYALVLQYNSVDANNGYFAIEYLNTDTSGTGAFITSQPLNLYHNVAGTDTNIATANVTSINSFIMVSVLDGTYYTKGLFVRTQAQQLLLTTVNPTCLIGFNVIDSIVDETTDNSLFSNAAGQPNFKGAGAARWKFELSLASIQAANKTSDFIELVVVDAGEIKRVTNTQEYSSLNTTLAERTYEQSGSFTVVNFPVEMFDSLRSDDTPDGLYSPAQGGDYSKYVARVKKGIAYVQGNRVELQSSTDIVQSKALDTNTVFNGVAPALYGSYIVVNLTNGLPELNMGARHNILDVTSAVIGTTIVRAVKSNNTGITQARLYLMDTRFNSGFSISDARAIHNIVGVGAPYTFQATLVTSSIFGGSTDSLVYPLPYTSVKTLTGAGPDITFDVTRSWDITLDSSGNGTVSLSGAETFGSVNSYDFFISTENGAALSVGFLSTSGNILSITAPGHGSSTVRVIGSVIKTNPTVISKILTPKTDVVTFSGLEVAQLSQQDVYKIESVVDNLTGLDVTLNFSLDNGQRANWYDLCFLVSLIGPITGSNFTVTYKYFQHTIGDYICVDSYVGMDKQDIPYTTSTSDGLNHNLSDCIDFRLVRRPTGIFEGPSFFDVIQPNDNFRFNLQYYLPRVDTVYVTTSGLFAIQTGISSVNPEASPVPSDAMPLYNLYVPAYTQDAHQIIATNVESQRFTMSDIGVLENRISNLEYFVSLSQIEQSIASKQILDPVTGNNQFKNGFAATGFTNFDMINIQDKDWNASVDLYAGRIKAPFVQSGIDMVYSAGGTKGASTVTLPYTTRLATTQPYATTTANVNPFSMYAWAGSVQLSPTSDFWRDTVYNNPIVLNLTSGLSASTTSGQPVAGLLQDILWDAGWQTAAPDTVSNVYKNKQILSSGQIQVQKVQPAVNILPFMRSVDIEFTLTNFKPLTTLTPFFGGINVSGVVTPTGGNPGDSVITDVHGSASGVFTVPTESAFRFKNGLNVLRFTDSPTNSLVPGTFSTAGDALFASGDEMNDSQAFSQTQTLRPVTSNWDNTGDILAQNRNPIAEVFRISSTGGGFVSSINLYFASKAANLPVTLQIRNIQDGVPSSEVLTFAEVVLNPDDVSISTDSSVATTFTFSDLVYLQANTQYAIVVFADTQDYRLFTSTVGSADIQSGALVVKQPNTGGLLIASNGNKWTPNPVTDLKFDVKIAHFNTAPITCTLRSSIPGFIPLPRDAISSVSGSNIITFNYNGHGLQVGDSFQLQGVVDGNGVSALLLNGTLTVASSTLNNFTVNIASPASATGSFGGSSIQFTPNFIFTDVNPVFNSLVVNGTSAAYSLVYLSASSRTPGITKTIKPNQINTLPIQGVVTQGVPVSVNIAMTSSNPNISPMIDLDGFGVEAISRLIDPTNPVYSVITQPVSFDNPSTTAKVYIDALVPIGNTMKVYYKPIRYGDDNLANISWAQIPNPVSPIQHSSVSFYQSEWDITGIGSFIGYVLQVVFLGNDPTLSPEIDQISTISLA